MNIFQLYYKEDSFVKINYFVHTEIGDRPCNEDRYAVSKCPAGLCFALADGLGGL